jgi:hypothetical protein
MEQPLTGWSANEETIARQAFERALTTLKTLERVNGHGGEV